MAILDTYQHSLFSAAGISDAYLLAKNGWLLKPRLVRMQTAKQEGAQLLTGGGVPQHRSKGFFVQPTVFTHVKPPMQIWREEIFGPVLAAATFSTEEEAIRLANESEFGLGAAVISADAEVRITTPQPIQLCLQNAK